MQKKLILFSLLFSSLCIHILAEKHSLDDLNKKTFSETLKKLSPVELQNLYQFIFWGTNLTHISIQKLNSEFDLLALSHKLIENKEKNLSQELKKISKKISNNHKHYFLYKGLFYTIVKKIQKNGSDTLKQLIQIIQNEGRQKITEYSNVESEEIQSLIKKVQKETANLSDTLHLESNTYQTLIEQTFPFGDQVDSETLNIATIDTVRNLLTKHFEHAYQYNLVIRDFFSIMQVMHRHALDVFKEYFNLLSNYRREISDT